MNIAVSIADNTYRLRVAFIIAANKMEKIRTLEHAACGMRRNEHNCQVQEQLNSRPTKVYDQKDYYVGRVLERLTVATMKLCRDSAQLDL